MEVFGNRGAEGKDEERKREKRINGQGLMERTEAQEEGK